MIRAATRAAIATAMTAGVEALGGTVYRWPIYRDPSPVRVVILGNDIRGEIDLPVFSGDSKSKSSDVWRFDVVCSAAASLQTAEEAEQLAEDLAEAVRVAVHTDPSLGGLHRTAGIAGQTWRLQHVVVAATVGPEILEMPPPDGSRAVCTVTLEASARVY